MEDVKEEDKVDNNDGDDKEISENEEKEPPKKKAAKAKEVKKEDKSEEEEEDEEEDDDVDGEDGKGSGEGKGISSFKLILLKDLVEYYKKLLYFLYKYLLFLYVMANVPFLQLNFSILFVQDFRDLFHYRYFVELVIYLPTKFLYCDAPYVPCINSVHL